jgi:8-oxo-dGTP diphosphatase
MATGDEVRAAGGLIYRHGRAGVEVSVVHRPRYDDWGLPKGKLDEGESYEEAALREVEEETGLVCRLLDPCGQTTYPHPEGREKVVRYWLMEPVVGEFQPGGEIDELRWLTVEDALHVLTYEEERALLRQSPLD